MPPPSLGGGGSGGGRWGGPVGSFARTSLSHSSIDNLLSMILRCSVMFLVMLLSPKACSWSILYSLRKQTISACHRQLYTLLFTASHRWKVLEHYLPGFVLRARAFTPTSFYARGSQGKVHPGALPFSVLSLTVKVFGFITHGQNQA